jgi:hypothetical protein
MHAFYEKRFYSCNFKRIWKEASSQALVNNDLQWFRKFRCDRVTCGTGFRCGFRNTFFYKKLIDSFKVKRMWLCLCQISFKWMKSVNWFRTFTSYIGEMIIKRVDYLLFVCIYYVYITQDITGDHTESEVT